MKKFAVLLAAMMLLGMVAAWAWTIIYAGGESHFGGVGGIIFAAVMFLAGFLLVVHTLKKTDFAKRKTASLQKTFLHRFVLTVWVCL